MINLLPLFQEITLLVLNSIKLMILRILKIIYEYVCRISGTLYKSKFLYKYTYLYFVQFYLNEMLYIYIYKLH